MKKPVFITAEKAVDMIQSGTTLCTIGMTLVSASESILKAIEKKFLAEGVPNQLTYFHTCGQSVREGASGPWGTYKKSDRRSLGAVSSFYEADLRE